MANSLDTFVPNLDMVGYHWLAVIAAPAVIIGLWRCLPRNHVEMKIPSSDSSLKITFGDIFDREGVIVIPVNEYFDGQLGNHVSKKSLHGQFIKNLLDGQSQLFYRLISEDLESVQSETVPRKSGRNIKYPIGTVARADINGRRFILAALSRTDTATLKSSATVHDLWDCMNGIWQGARNFSNGENVNVPLIGSGLSRVGLPQRNLIDIIMTSLLYCTKEQKIADNVTLVLPDILKEEIDLVAIKRSWTSGI